MSQIQHGQSSRPSCEPTLAQKRITSCSLCKVSHCFGTYSLNSRRLVWFPDSRIKTLEVSTPKWLSRLDIDETCSGVKGQACYSAQVSIGRILCRLGSIDLHMRRQSEAPGKKKLEEGPIIAPAEWPGGAGNGSRCQSVICF